MNCTTSCTHNCRQGRDCEGSRRATSRAAAGAMWLVIGTSALWIAIGVANAFGGRLPF